MNPCGWPKWVSAFISADLAGHVKCGCHQPTLLVPINYEALERLNDPLALTSDEFFALMGRAMRGDEMAIERVAAIQTRAGLRP